MLTQVHSATTDELSHRVVGASDAGMQKLHCAGSHLAAAEGMNSDRKSSPMG
jgi:hypothetical protein